MMSNAQVALMAAATFGAPRFKSGADEIEVLADTWLEWLDSKEKK